MTKLRDFFQLLSLKISVTFFNAKEYGKVVSRYYANPLFRKVDVYILRNYLLQNPYRMCKEFLRKKGEKNIYAYGETPLTTLEAIARTCGVSSHDVFYELGSGRGRSCFWLRCFIGCKVVGVEFVPDFVKIAAKAGRLYDVKGVKFIYRDILDADISEATVVYFYGTSSENDFILKLIDKLRELPSGTKVITVSYPLTSYAPEEDFELVESFPARFTWGETDVYLQVRK